jgi:hypothetical protein
MITANINGAGSGANQATLVFTYSSTGTIANTKMERRKGNNPFESVATDPVSPYIDHVSTPGQYTYRLKVVLSNGQVGYSNEKNIQVKKK